jgi:hypothetical protein
MSPEVSKLLEFLDEGIRTAKRAILSDALGGTNADQVATNYKSACLNLRNMEEIRLRAEEILTQKEQSEQDDSGLEPMDEGK